MKSIFRYISHVMALFLAVSMPSYAYGGTASLKVSMDSAYVLMGKATPMHITLVADDSSRGQLLIPADSLCGNVEILRMLPADTTRLGNNRMELTREILLQSFDSGTYLLKPILYVDGGETIASNRLALKVIPAMVDSLTTIHDYADVQDVKRHLVDYLPDFIADYGLWILAVIVVLVIAWLLLRRYLRRSDGAEVETVVPQQPPYEAAMEALDALRAKNLCEQGREREYYTTLTEILRVYLSRRFGINAMEMTSSDIRATLTRNEQTRPSKKYVDQVLEIADFVKFAKMRPLPDDNVRAFNSALRFVEDTKPVDKPEESDEAADSDDKSKQTKSE